MGNTVWLLPIYRGDWVELYIIYGLLVDSVLVGVVVRF